MLISFSSTRSSVMAPLLAAWAAPCFRRCCPRCSAPVSPARGGAAGGGATVELGGVELGGVELGGAALGGVTLAGGGAVTGVDSAGGGGAIVLALSPEFADFGSPLASAGLPSGFGAEARLARSGFSECPFSAFTEVLVGGSASAGTAFSAAFSVGFSISGGRPLPTVAEVLSLLLAKFPSLPGH